MRQHRDRKDLPPVPTADERPSVGGYSFTPLGDYNARISMRVNELGRLDIKVKSDPLDPLGKHYPLTLALGS